MGHAGAALLGQPVVVPHGLGGRGARHCGQPLQEPVCARRFRGWSTTLQRRRVRRNQDAAQQQDAQRQALAVWRTQRRLRQRKILSLRANVKKKA